MSTNPPWNLDRLREHVRAKGCAPVADSAQELIFSIDRSARIFHYHMITARDAMKGMISERDANDPGTVLHILGASENQQEFERARVVSEAHIIGCLHTARGTWDLFAQLVNALVLSAALSEEACDIHGVSKALPPSDLKEAIEKLLDSHWFGYVQAYINTTKHRRLIPHTTSLSWAENRAGVKLGAFAYRKQSFKEYWGTEVLEGAIEVKNAVVVCGNLLNAKLGV